jgi:pimeloyl-ACP methyl ester carboxylesterase
LMQPMLLKGMFAPRPVPARFARGSTPKMSVRPGQIRAESQDGVAMIPGAFATRHRYQELAMPVVIMAGTKDTVVSADQPAQLHAQIPHSVLRLVPDVGHMLHYAVPEEVAEAVEETAGSAKISRNAQSTSARAA